MGPPVVALAVLVHDDEKYSSNEGDPLRDRAALGPVMRGATLSRRLFLAGLGASAIDGCTCSGSPPPPQASPASPSDAWAALAFDPDALSPEGQRALLFSKKGEAPRPLLIALHGRGESGRGLDVGARGWRDDYGLERLDDRLRHPPLTSADLLDLIAPETLAQMNASLARDPYEGLTVATPYAPDLRDRSPAGASGFGRFVTERLIPRAKEELGAAWDRSATAIDGVSMGGRLSLLVGLTHPETFGSIGALQPAIGVGDAPWLVELAQKALEKWPISLHLVSSEGDPFLPSVRAFSDLLGAAKIAHALTVTPGPHDYVWNRGPGGALMLLGHERALRGLAAP